MKHLRKRSLAFFLATVLALTPVASASEALGSELRDRSDTVAPGVTVTNQSLWSAAYSDLRTEHYINYTPGGSVSAVVAYGSYVRSRAALSSMAAKLEEQGLRVVGGINAGFYNTTNGTPIGLVISDGMLRSAIPNFCSIGFRSDGSAVIGTPTVTITASWLHTLPTEATGSEEPTGTEEPVEAPTQSVTRATKVFGYNKVRTESGVFLFSDEFGTKTLNSTEGIDVILRPLADSDIEDAATLRSELPVSGSITCEVAAVRGSLEDTTIPEGCFVLSVADTASEWHRLILSDLKLGDVITLETGIDEEWTEVVQAVSGLYTLVEDGQVGSDLPAGINPYTAAGIRADGTVVLYTIDGRQSGYSIGATYRQVAKRLIELGCVSAIALDGGGSTTFGTTYADAERFQSINRPSEGTERMVSTALFLVTDAGQSGELGGFYLAPEQDVVLAGSSVDFTVTAVDTNGYAMEWEGRMDLSAELGEIGVEEGVLRYTAPLTGGTDVLRAASDGVDGSAKLLVVDTLSSLTIWNELTGEQAFELSVPAGELIDLSVSALYYNLPVSCTDADFTWTLDNAVGTVDEHGVFAAGLYSGSTLLTVSGGGQTVTIPITVTGGDPFCDIANHWAYEYILALAGMGITNGVPNGDGTYSYRPDGSLSRGDLITLVVRMLGVDLTQYEGIQLPFADVDTIQGWLLPYVKAAYGMGLLSGSEVDGVLYANVTDLVSREMAMVIIGRTLGYTVEGDLSAFEDEGAISAWAAEYVQTLVALGIINGNGTSLNPSGGVLRGEVAKMIAMTLSLPAIEEDLESGGETSTEISPDVEIPETEPNGEFPPKDDSGEKTPTGEPCNEEAPVENETLGVSPGGDPDTESDGMNAGVTANSAAAQTE